MDRSGAVLSQRDLAALLSTYMRSQGGDASLFVRPGVDWLDMNSTTYVPRDPSLLVGCEDWGTAPRLILPNAQKSARGNTPIFAE